jgi:transmembrane sensor
MSSGARSHGVVAVFGRGGMRETAAHWHDQIMAGEMSEERRAEFSRWIDQSPAHRAAYEAVERTCRLAQSAGAVEPAILALRHEAALRITRQPARRWGRPSFAAAAVIMAFLSGAIALRQWSEVSTGWHPSFDIPGMFNSAPTARVNRRYSTAVGERLSFVLEDGSQVELNTDSTLETAFVANERRVMLTRGQALFEVTKDASRPFVVEASGRRFVAVGTAFDVRLDVDTVSVTMLEGTVRVERASDAIQHSPVIATVTAGEQITLERNHDEAMRIAVVDRMDHLTSWRRGQLIFENARLADAVAEVNRYSATQITLADKDLEDLRISGAFAIGRPTVFIEALSSYFPIDVTRVGDSTLVLNARHERVQNRTE